MDSWYPGWRGGCKDCRVPLRSLMHSTHNTHTQPVKAIDIINLPQSGLKSTDLIPSSGKVSIVVTEKALHRLSKMLRTVSTLGLMDNTYCTS